jgi:hypothetical protein
VDGGNTVSNSYRIYYYRKQKRMENNKSAGIRGDLISVLLGGEVNMGYLIVTMIFCITLEMQIDILNLMFFVND